MGQALFFRRSGDSWGRESAKRVGNLLRVLRQVEKLAAASQ